MQTLNLGILAHVDAGKTSLTERLLHAAGVIDEVGSVDDGSTQTDSLALERQRGITIKSAVVSFAVDDVTVNLIDTPGHPDFIAEVERVLGVLDGAVLVVSAVEGVQAQTRVLMRTLRRLRIPTLIFVNKIDRRGARYDGVAARRSRDEADPGGRRRWARPTTSAPATRALHAVRRGDAGLHRRGWPTCSPSTTTRCSPRTSTTRRRSPTTGCARRWPRRPGGRSCTRCSSARPITGAGVDAADRRHHASCCPPPTGDADGPVSGTVFKVERGPAGEKIAYVRMFSGTRAHPGPAALRADGREGEGKVTGDQRLRRRRSDVRRAVVGAGRIGRLWGLGERPDRRRDRRRRGRSAGAAATSPRRPWRPSSSPCRAADRGALHVALAQLAEQDPLIDLRQDDLRRRCPSRSTARCRRRSSRRRWPTSTASRSRFRETTTICIERPAGTGAAVEIIDTDPNPFLATVGLRVEPGPDRQRRGVPAGGRARLDAATRSCGRSRRPCRETLRQGLHGWQVTDCVVTMTHSGYWPRQSHAHGDVRQEHVEHGGRLPQADAAGADGRAAAGRHARCASRCTASGWRSRPTPSAPVAAGARPAARRPAGPGDARRASYVLEGEIPAARVHELEQLLPALTRGEGVLESRLRPLPPGQRPAPDRPAHRPQPAATARSTCCARCGGSPADFSPTSGTGPPCRSSPGPRSCRRGRGRTPAGCPCPAPATVERAAGDRPWCRR